MKRWYLDLMQKQNNSFSKNWWETYLKHLGKLDLSLLEYLPNFMIISPPRTGSTWLSLNLRCHPDIFIPSQKELRFFSTFWKSFDINWYLSHFRDSDKPIKGEASPSYALLPTRIIKLISLLVPKLKLIFLMRNPVTRAWSHANHIFKHGVLDFKGQCNDLYSISEEKWLENFSHDYNLSFSDYVGSLRRWLAFFPKEQFLLGFYESIKEEPKKLITDIFKFLEVEKEVEWSQFPLAEKINIGQQMEISTNLEQLLKGMYLGKIEKIQEFLQKEFNLMIHEEWKASLKQNESRFHDIGYQEEDEEKRLMEILFSIESDFIMERESSHASLIESHKGFDFILYKHKFYAFAQSLGPLNIPELTEKEITYYREQFKCVIADMLFDAKKQVDAIFEDNVNPENCE